MGFARCVYDGRGIRRSIMPTFYHAPPSTAKGIATLGASQIFGVIQPTKVGLFRPAANGRPTPSRITPTYGRRRATIGAKRLKSPSLLGKCLAPPLRRGGGRFSPGVQKCAPGDFAGKERRVIQPGASEGPGALRLCPWPPQRSGSSHGKLEFATDNTDEADCRGFSKG